MAPGNQKNLRHALTSASEYMLVDFLADFPDDEACLVWLWDQRYNLGNDEAHCERCGEIRQFRRYTAKQRRQDWTCTACGLHVHPTAGTIFHKSSTGLHLWFYAMYLMTSTRCGISAKQLERELGVTYKTAWRIFRLIREQLMGHDAPETETEQLNGVVEMDETHVGGKPRNSDRARRAKEAESAGPLASAVRRSLPHKWAAETKSQVFGAVERGGRVAAYVIPSRQKETLTGHVHTLVSPQATVYTDAAHAYGTQPQQHETVNHHIRVFVSGNVHTQTIDSFWSQVKRGIIGVHHSVSPQHFQGYLNEYVWRFNHRNDGRAMFFKLAIRSAFPGTTA